MSAQVHNLTQGSKQWLAHRQHYFNASEAAAMLGISSYKSRDALLKDKATGSTQEVNQATQRIFDEGHRLETQALPRAQAIVGEDLFQPTMSKTVDGLKLSASFDGLTMLDDMVWEHKTLNKKLRANLSVGIIPDEYKPQLEQQLLVSGADKVLFMASNNEEEMHLWYESEPFLRKRLIAGWKQFSEDLKNWKQVEITVEPIAESVEALPSLNVQITGGVTASNLATYEKTALAFIDNINTDLKTDSDFANADIMVKFCSKTEKELDAVKKSALDQTADIADLFKTIDRLKFEMRDKRLELYKLVKSRKASIRGEIVGEAKYDIRRYIDDKNSNLPTGISVAFYDVDFNSVIKNKRTVQSLRNAVNTELARCKIEVSEQADLLRGNYDALQDVAGEYGFLFRDLDSILTKDRDDLLNLAKQRIAEHKEAETKRLEMERERIRKEEEAKAQAKVEVERKAEHEARLEEERAHMKAQNSRIASERLEAEKAKESNTQQTSEPIQAAKPEPEKVAESNDHQTSDKPDCAYFIRELNKVKRELGHYTKDELRRIFERLRDAV